MRLLLALLLWSLAGTCTAGTLAEAIRICADRLDAGPPGEAAGAGPPGDAPHMVLALDCPEALQARPRPGLDGLSIERRRMTTPDWRAFAATLETFDAEAPGSGPVTGLEVVLAELDPAPLAGFEGRVPWRERLGAWVLRKLRWLFGPETALGRWLDGLDAADLRAFSDAMLVLVLVLFALLLAGLGVLLHRALGRRGGAVHRAPPSELPATLATVPLLPAEQIRALPPGRQPVALMRLVVARIDEAGLCATAASMTNSEVATQLACEAGIGIDALARLADRCLFAGHAASAAELAPCWAELEALEAHRS